MLCTHLELRRWKFSDTGYTVYVLNLHSLPISNLERGPAKVLSWIFSICSVSERLNWMDHINPAPVYCALCLLAGFNWWEAMAVRAVARRGRVFSFFWLAPCWATAWEWLPSSPKDTWPVGWLPPFATTLTDLTSCSSNLCLSPSGLARSGFLTVFGSTPFFMSSSLLVSFNPPIP